ncbi:MAG TPA: hypothetical protein VHF90_04270 [Thermoleophilaceae bacterium]|nr:hypothetical protein [Thermoleophilaceae bacterium]
MQPASTAGALALLLAGLCTQAGLPIVYAVLMPFVATLLANHVDRESLALAQAIVSRAALAVPAPDREEHLDEWLDHVQAAGERGVSPLTRGLSIALLAAPLLAVGLRIGRGRSRRRRSAS